MKTALHLLGWLVSFISIIISCLLLLIVEPIILGLASVTTFQKQEWTLIPALPPLLRELSRGRRLRTRWDPSVRPQDDFISFKQTRS